MNDPQPFSPRRRLQTLLAIPDSQRTEAQWDEIVELEIQLAPGNRQDAPGRVLPANTDQPRRSSPGPSQGPGAGAGPNPGQKGHKTPFRNRGRAPKKPPQP